MALWMIEHHISAYNNYMMNNKSVTAIQQKFQFHFNIHWNHAILIDSTILHWVNVLCTRGTPMNRKSLGKARNPRKCGMFQISFDMESESFWLETFHWTWHQSLIIISMRHCFSNHTNCSLDNSWNHKTTHSDLTLHIRWKQILRQITTTFC